MSEMIHAIEEWLMEYGVFGLFFVSFADSSFFPIPPDVLLIPMGISNPDNVLWYAFITTAASVLGAILGWFIGKKLGRPVLRYIISEERIQKVEDYFTKYGAMAILISAFTPIPYKVFTIFAGISNIRLRVLVIWSIIGRGARFFLEAAIIMVLGAQAKTFIEENFTLLTLIGGLVILVVYVIYLVLKKRNKTV
ncbi:membrane protein YqaA with SNARE-associated domain [Cytobacillus oceanisediminis]|jgi:undecaprenyl-diphosphatase|uniref:Membrane protein YqaA with SNARE-associated domain n=1 Tax=Cytobacillus oceanisediminis TaxID=665099 RepID=A0A2V2ZPG6_9BACI|nr:YqaA family protein [Cytobacillus oceanisediminis]PWW20050.1 membrane protein YqaA with SNARE-associated domain [Cytobacillus oceanisediminis]